MVFHDWIQNANSQIKTLIRIPEEQESNGKSLTVYYSDLQSYRSFHKVLNGRSPRGCQLLLIMAKGDLLDFANLLCK